MGVMYPERFLGLQPIFGTPWFIKKSKPFNERNIASNIAEFTLALSVKGTLLSSVSRWFMLH